MIRTFLRLFTLATLLSLFSFIFPLQATAADQQPADKQWADGLTISGFDGGVTILVSDLQGNTYAGGDFTAYGGKPVNHIAKWDGLTWSALGDGLQNQVNTLAVDSRGYLYTDALVIPESGLPETIIMHWDGTSWSTLGGDLSSLVDTLAEGRESNILINDLAVDSRDQLYAGGYFYLIQSDQYVGYVARWDGSSWTLLGSGMNHTVYELAVDGHDNLYAGGEFTSAGGVAASRIAKWDGVTWNALGSGLGGDAPTVADLELDPSGKLFVTGQFETAGGKPIHLVAIWDGASWNDLTTGKSSSGLEGEAPTIFDLSVSRSGELYAGGSFTTIDGVAANNIARWNGSSWNALSTKDGNGINESVSAISVNEDEQVFAGGYFTNAGGLPAGHIARWDGSSWFTWSAVNGYGMNNIISALVVDHNGILYAGGYFSSAGMVAANHIARWDGKAWNQLAGGVNAAVHALALDTNVGLYAGGDFTAAGDLAVNYIARWDGASWHALGAGMGSDNSTSQVRALAVDNQGNLYAGGDFNIAGGVAANYIARWDGSAWSALGRGMDDQVTRLVVDPQGNLYAAGWFTRAGDVAASGIARWDGTSWSALGGEGNMVESITIGQDGNLYAAGMFSLPSDVYTSAYIARWDGSTWSRLSESTDNLVHVLAADQKGNLYAGGDFSTAGEAPAGRIASWDGTAWTSLGSGIGGEGDYSSILTLIVDDQGNLYVGGQFTLAGDKPSAYLAKWCPERVTGDCTFTFEARAGTPEPTPVLSTAAPLSTQTPTLNVPGPGLTPTSTPIANHAGADTIAGLDRRYWIGAGFLLVFIVAGLVLLRFRRS